MNVNRDATVGISTSTSRSGYVVGFARTTKEVEEAQRLRYQVFVEELGVNAAQNHPEMDVDEFDAYCQHLIVRDADSGLVVACYRLLTPDCATRRGKLYSDGEFDLGRLASIRASSVEMGRACIHPAHRGGAVLLMLWSAIARFMRSERYEHLIGCASVSLADGGANAVAVSKHVLARYLAPREFRVTPRNPFPVDAVDRAVSNEGASVPPLLKGYIRIGAWVCGDPAWDPDFNSTDFFVLLPMYRLSAQYARHFFGSETPVAPTARVASCV